MFLTVVQRRLGAVHGCSGAGAVHGGLRAVHGGPAVSGRHAAVSLCSPGNDNHRGSQSFFTGVYRGLSCSSGVCLGPDEEETSK